jgi:hypothetical protein
MAKLSHFDDIQSHQWLFSRFYFLFLFADLLSTTVSDRSKIFRPLHFGLTKKKKIFAQILLTFRYGRDDEEVMGLKLSNESVLCVEQIYPLLPGAPLPQPLTKCQVLKKKKEIQ